MRRPRAEIQAFSVLFQSFHREAIWGARCPFSIRDPSFLLAKVSQGGSKPCRRFGEDGGDTPVSLCDPVAAGPFGYLSRQRRVPCARRAGEKQSWSLRQGLFACSGAVFRVPSACFTPSQ